MASAVFNLSSALVAAYGRSDRQGQDLRDASAVLRFAVDFVERKEKWHPLPEAHNERQDRGLVEVAAVSTHSVGRKQLRELLTAAARDSLPEVTDKLLAEATNRLPSITRLEATADGAIQYRTIVNVADAGAFQMLVRLILANPEHRRSVGCCQHQQCSKLFVVHAPRGRTGPPNRFYCGPAHMRAGHDGAHQRNERRAVKFLTDRGHSRDAARLAVREAAHRHPDAKASQLKELADAFLRENRRR